MCRPTSDRYGACFRFLTQVLLGSLLITTALSITSAQENQSSLVRIFKLEGSFGAEVSARFESQNENVGFTLRSARIESDSLGFLTRVRSILTIGNGDGGRRITEVEWRLDIYDDALRSLTQQVLQKDKANIYPGETATVSAKFGALLPDKMIVLLQIVRVSFADGSAWSPAIECGLNTDLKTISCKGK
jgi:hypothetical protein